MTMSAKKTSKVDDKKNIVERMRESLQTRGPFSKINALKEKGYFYRLVTTGDASDLRHLELGYEYVNGGDGKRVAIPAGNNDTLVLMRIPDALKKELDKLKSEEVEEMEASMNPRLREEKDKHLYGGSLEYK